MNLFRKILWSVREGLLLGPGFYWSRVSGLLGRKYHVATIKEVGPVYVRPDSSDTGTFIKIFVKKEYDLSHLGQFSRVSQAYQCILGAGKTPIIIDAGANVGAASLWFSRQFPLAAVLAVEPDPANAEVCRLNTRALPAISVIEAAIGSAPGFVSLTDGGAAGGYAVQTKRSGDTGPVAIRTVQELIRNVQSPAQLFIVKIDIEGFETDLFARNTEWVDEAEVIVIEPHDWLFPGEGTSAGFQKVMAERNFEMLISGENLFYVRLPQA